MASKIEVYNFTLYSKSFIDFPLVMRNIFSTNMFDVRLTTITYRTKVDSTLGDVVNILDNTHTSAKHAYTCDDHRNVCSFSLFTARTFANNMLFGTSHEMQINERSNKRSMCNMHIDFVERACTLFCNLRILRYG